MVRHTTNITVNGHFIVVEDDDHGLMAFSGIIQALIGHTAGSRAVTDDGNHIIILTGKRSRPSHAQRDRNRA